LEETMPHYLYQGRYSPEALNAMIAKPQDREASARKLIEAAGGKLVCFYFAFGSEDVVAIFEARDDAMMAAVAFTVGASGGFVGGSTTKLMTSGEAMEAMAAAKKLAASYRPPSPLAYEAQV
jgi:uncharacterized protein with GYD domain